MFNLFKKKKSNKISNLEKRICDIEKPYKYEVGDKVTIFTHGIFKKDDTGVIVNRDYKYNDITIELKVMLGNHRHFESEYERINLYDIYIEDFKRTEQLKESQIKKQNK